MKTVRSPGLEERNACDKSRPFISGIMTSVSSRSILPVCACAIAMASVAEFARRTA